MCESFGDVGFSTSEKVRWEKVKVKVKKKRKKEKKEKKENKKHPELWWKNPPGGGRSNHNGVAYTPRQKCHTVTEKQRLNEAPCFLEIFLLIKSTKRRPMSCSKVYRNIQDWSLRLSSVLMAQRPWTRFYPPPGLHQFCDTQSVVINIGSVLWSTNLELISWQLFRLIHLQHIRLPPV